MRQTLAKEYLQITQGVFYNVLKMLLPKLHKERKKLAREAMQVKLVTIRWWTVCGLDGMMSERVPKALPVLK